MITFNELLERAKSEKIVVHTPTEAQAITLLKALDEKGYTWFCGEKLTNMARYEGFRENTCYVFSRDCCGSKLYKEIRYGSLKVHQECGYTIIEFKDIDFAEKTVKKALDRNKKQAKILDILKKKGAIQLFTDEPWEQLEYKMLVGGNLVIDLTEEEYDLLKEWLNEKN